MRVTQLNERNTMVGNLVRYEGKIYEIDTIAAEFPTLNTDEFGIGVVDWNNIEPIPLTPEILAQLGFKKLPVSWGCDKFHLTEWDEFPLNWCVSMNVNNAILVLRLVHVHQLQNLYWCLTGQELTLAEK
jgi:hypothetical protein